MSSPLSRDGSSWIDYERAFMPDLRAQPSRMVPQRTASVRRTSPPDYKPMPLRWTFLASLIVILMILIAVLESACRFLPPEVDRDNIPEAPAVQTSSPPDIGTAQPTLKARRMQEFRRFAQNTTTIAPSTTVVVSPSTSVETITRPPVGGGPRPGINPNEQQPDEVTPEEEKPTGEEVIVTISDNPFIGDASNYGEPGVKTITVSIPPTTQASSMHGLVGVVTIKSTTLEKVVSTITKDFTYTGLTVVTTAAGVTTTTLSGLVVSFSEVQTLDKVVSQYETTTTVFGIVAAIGPSYATPSVVTVTGADGTVTATVTRTPPPVSTPTTITMTDAGGTPTRTITANVQVPARTRVLTNSVGWVTMTVTEYPTFPTEEPGPPQQASVQVYSISKGQYFVGFFLPTLLAVMLTIPVRMIDMAAKQFQPWHALTHRGGASAEESMCLRSDGIRGIATSVRAMTAGQPLALLTKLLMIASIFLVPLSSEAVALKLHGSCSNSDFNGCAMTLGVFLAPARATIALLGVMILLMILILLVLRKWRTGVASNPWTIAGVASLTTNSEVRAVFSSLPVGRGKRVTHEQLAMALEGKNFRLGHFFNQYGIPEYGIMMSRDGGQGVWDGRPESSEGLVSPQDDETTQDLSSGSSEHHLPFLMLSYTGRIAFLVPLTALMVVILYYNNTGGGTAFERFMSTQSFGARALFTMVGVGITFFWSSFFTSLAILSPYQLMSQAPRRAENSITLSPPLNAFSGMWSAVKRRHLFLIVVAMTAILSEFMPVLLNNVPFRVTQTWITSRVCTWLAVGILSIMWLVVVGSFFVRWPHMPVDPSTIAGSMYYVCDSWMLWSVEGLSMLSKKERDRKVIGMGLRFRFGNIVGLSGRKRVGVDGLKDLS
ncbi:hypothetical protein QBC35DRAFT_382965 [Podospora australis]|uniref:Zonadhesin n=1 Tax=Podospora australis TaxID=1536484 RepID=A0AAN6WU83_9PEZI|nr:hypothetical protein QBC35DRAFT_382965 [Podospora australis]